MRLRSMLFVPGDSERKFEKARGCGADALILDLEDSVAASNKSAARTLVARLIAQTAPPASRPCGFWVRVNAFDTGLIFDDLAAVVVPGLDGIVFPKSNGAEDLLRLAHALDVLEARASIAPEHVKIVVVATETPAAIFQLGSYAPAHPRLAAMTWGAEDLGAAVGATANKEPDGEWTQPYQVVRSLCLFAATSAGVLPLDTLHADFRDRDGLAAGCRRSRRDGFVGRIAIHPDQVETINAAFTPTDAEIAWAQRVVAAFAEAGTGTIGLDGKMLDRPHLKQAERLLGSLHRVPTQVRV